MEEDIKLCKLSKLAGTVRSQMKLALIHFNVNYSCTDHATLDQVYLYVKTEHVLHLHSRNLATL